MSSARMDLVVNLFNSFFKTPLLRFCPHGKAFLITQRDFPRSPLDFEESGKSPPAGSR